MPTAKQTLHACVPIYARLNDVLNNAGQNKIIHVTFKQLLLDEDDEDEEEEELYSLSVVYILTIIIKLFYGTYRSARRLLPHIEWHAINERRAYLYMWENFARETA